MNKKLSATQVLTSHTKATKQTTQKPTPKQAKATNSPKSTSKISPKNPQKRTTKIAQSKKLPNTKLIKQATDSNFLSLVSLDSMTSDSTKTTTRIISKKSNTAKTPPIKSTKSTTKSTSKPKTTPKSSLDNLAKQQQIVSMFDDIAKDYDRANHLLSLGIDISWRSDACKRAYKALQQNRQDTQKLCIADIACGTGDMLLQWHKEAKKANITLDSLIGIDPSKEMLKIAQNKIKDKIQLSTKKSTPSPKILIKVGQAKDLAVLQKNSIDILSISYGLRNVLEYDKALKEFKRVLKPNGILVVLDFFKKPNPSLLDRLISIYTRLILPVFGWIISSNYKAYKYLPDSMDSFVSPQKLALDLQSLGFIDVQIKGYSANISHLVLARKS